MANIQFFENIFKENFCTFLLSNAREGLNGGANFSSNFRWEDSVTRASTVVLTRDYDTILSKFILDALIEKKIIEHLDYSVMSFAWTRLSYIPWHNDGTHSEAITIYLNDKWDLDWGGLFLFKDENEDIRAFAPRFNCGLRNMNNVWHATTPVSLDSPEPRFSIQIFPNKVAAGPGRGEGANDEKVLS